MRRGLRLLALFAHPGVSGELAHLVPIRGLGSSASSSLGFWGFGGEGVSWLMREAWAVRFEILHST